MSHYGIISACRVLQMSKSVYYYKPLPKDDSVIERALKQKAEEKPEEGFWKAYQHLRAEGNPWNHKRLHRIYKALGLPLRRKAKKRLPARVKEPLEVPAHINHTWSMDFVTDVFYNKRRFRAFTIIDDYNREVLCIEIDYSLTSNRIIWVLNHLINKKGKPTQNAYIERFNGSYRRGVLDKYIFENLDQVREQTPIWMEDYNYHRPHDALGNIPPIQYAKLKRRDAVAKAHFKNSSIFKPAMKTEKSNYF